MNPRMIQRVREVIGRPVRNGEGEEIGRVEELVLDVDRGLIAYALVRVETPEAKWFAVPWGSLHADAEGVLRLEVRPDVFQSSPGLTAAAV